MCSALVLLAAGCVPPANDPDLDPTTDGESSESGDESTDESSESGDESTDDGTPDECPVGNGPTEHQDGATDQVWSAEDSPHVIPYDMTLAAAITIEPCAVVQLGGGITVTVADGGSIDAEGARFERLDAEDPWVSIRLIGGTMSLEDTVVSGGGDPLNGSPHIAAAIEVRGPSGATAPTATLHVRDVVIEDSLSQGVRVQDNGAFTVDSDNLAVVGAAGSPISAAFDGAGSIPAGEYTGNGDDRIIVTDQINDSVSTDMTLHDRGVPYLVGQPGQLADLRVDAGPGLLATLTIEPGVEMQFRPGAVMRIDPDGAEEPATGAMIAIGTADEPIVFTAASEDPMPGEWLGLVFGSEVAPATALEHVRVEYAGGESTSGSNSCPYGGGDGINEAAVRILGVPTGAFIGNTTIVASANHGIDRGWRDDFVVDFTASNEFDVAGCRQTVPRTESGVCPDPVPCE